MKERVENDAEKKNKQILFICSLKQTNEELTLSVNDASEIMFIILPTIKEIAFFFWASDLIKMLAFHKQ